MNGRKNTPPRGLPAHARKAFAGEFFDIWQWNQEMFDGSTQIFERAVRADTVNVIATVKNKILLEEQEQPARDSKFFSLPGGVADNGGTPLEEIKRELLEETGYASEDWQPWKNFVSTNRVMYSAHYFIARDCKKIAKPDLDPGERIAVRFISFDELLMLSEDPAFRGIDFTNMLLRLRLDPKAKEDFKDLLFPKS